MLRLHTLAALACLTIVSPVSEIQAQQTAAPAVAAAAAPAGLGATAAVAPRASIWSFLGVPQTARGLRTLRSRVVNRRGNFPGLERKPPVLPLTAPENLESPNPAIKTAAEIKGAEDMKAQKIKAIKYLASLGCGCYDKDGKITDALLAATDDCTPDVRLAAIEAVEDNVNKSCCKSCGTTSCCNEKISKRLSEMAYERDDDGCPVETSAEIRRAAARVFKKCCPGGLYNGPIEEELQEVVEGDPVEMIPAPEPDEAPVQDPEPEEEIPGESVDEDEEISGESDAESDADSDADSDGEDSMELDDDSDNPFEDADAEEVEAPEGETDSGDLILRRLSQRQPVKIHFADSMNQPKVKRLDVTANSSVLVPVKVEPRTPELPQYEALQLNAATPAATVYAKPKRESVAPRVIEASPVSVIRSSTRVHMQPAASDHDLDVDFKRNGSENIQPMKLEPATTKLIVPESAEPKVVPETAPSAVRIRRNLPLKTVQSVEPVFRSRSIAPAPQSISVEKRMPRKKSAPMVRPTSFMNSADSPPYSIIEKKPTAPAVSSMQRSGSRKLTTLDPSQRFSAFGNIVSVDLKTRQVLLKPIKHEGIRVGVVAEVVRLTPQGYQVLGKINVKVIGRTIATAQINDPNLLRQIRATDKFVCHY